MDLNLLVQLDALLAERSVSGAARRLGQSQPTLSGALSKLRRHFDDQLLVRSRGGYTLTPLAARLLPLTGVALTSTERVFASVGRFDPAVSEREFTVVTSDYGGAAVLPSLLRVIGEQSGAVRVRQVPPVADGVDQTLRSVDVLFMPRGVVRGLPFLDLLRDEWVCVVDGENPHVDGEFTLEDMGRLPCVLMTAAPLGGSVLGATTSPVHQLQLLGVQLRVAASVNSFLAIPPLLVGSERFAILPRSLVRLAFPDAGLRLLPCPFPVVPLVEAAWWHPIHENDAGHRWFRQCLGRVAAELRGLKSR
ncbi:LysR family transcriptional regulator [Streptomyces sp. NPDC094034]|uniref:LysR family transcriptional regulator n=1 Tax=Streptomyces sp. NPDC094034 TaxID=3155309 RepID=UPI003325B790